MLNCIKRERLKVQKAAHYADLRAGLLFICNLYFLLGLYTDVFFHIFSKISVKSFDSKLKTFLLVILYMSPQVINSKNMSETPFFGP
jgi:hypothetical protein